MDLKEFKDFKLFLRYGALRLKYTPFPVTSVGRLKHKKQAKAHISLSPSYWWQLQRRYAQQYRERELVVYQREWRY